MCLCMCVSIFCPQFSDRGSKWSKNEFQHGILYSKGLKLNRMINESCNMMKSVSLQIASEKLVLGLTSMLAS